MYKYYLTNICFIYRVNVITQVVEYLTPNYIWKKSDYYTADNLHMFSNKPQDGLGKIFKVSKKSIDRTIRERINKDKRKLVSKLTK